MGRNNAINRLGGVKKREIKKCKEEYQRAPKENVGQIGSNFLDYRTDLHVQKHLDDTISSRKF